ncbi:MAG: DNA polymerase III subunit delta, partial [Clostridia bacterium]|nr:DNA polymerase III subunit delta [Clostridia bacterium]
MNSKSSDFSLTVSSPVFSAERDAIRAGRGSHAYLLTGQADIGKRSFALACACALLCRQENAPCMVCPSCRKVMAGNHPDVHILTPDKNLFRVDQVREMLASLYESPYEGGAKAYVLCGFHKANEQAQNALLKSLEEPPRAVTFFLLAENPYALLPTVRSRCKTLKMPRFYEADIFA